MIPPLGRVLRVGVGDVTQWYGTHPEWYAKFGLPFHNGLDYGCPVGSDVLAVINGIVRYKPFDPTGYGIYMYVVQGEVWTLYGHLSKFIAEEGTEVKVGTVVALSGNTGNSTGAHVHLGVRNCKYGFTTQPCRGWADPWQYR